MFVCCVAEVLRKTASSTKEKVMVPLDAAWAELTPQEQKDVKNKKGRSFAK